jgi:hypothetical protein
MTNSCLHPRPHAKLPANGWLPFCVAALIALGVPQAHAAPLLDTENIEAMKENKRVVIDSFGVEFYSRLHAAGKRGGNVAEVVMRLDGVEDATRQAITEQAYADTVQALTKAGFEVMDIAQLAAQPVFQALDGKYGKPSPYKVEDSEIALGSMQISQIYAPAGRKAYFQTGTGRGDFTQRVDAQNQGIGRQKGDLAKAVNATLLDAHLQASFGALSATKNNGLLAGLGATTARSAITPQPMLVAQETQIQFTTTSGARTFGNSRRMGHTGAVFLKDALVAPNNIFARSDAPAEPAPATPSAATGSMLGGLFSSPPADAAASALKPSSDDAYRSTYQALLREAIDAMVGTLAAAAR